MSPKLSDIYGGNYLQADDLKDKGDINVTIEKTSIMEGNDGKKKVVLHFAGKDKTLPLNVTNANMVEELLGSDDTDDWEGRRICLYTCKVDFQGKRVLAIRVKAAGAKAKPLPNPQPKRAREVEPEDIDSEFDAAEQAQESPDDQVPF